MATQYTAGLSSGQILTAAIMNQIGAAWVDFTPTLTQNVTVTKTTTVARYCQIQKTVVGNMKLDVTGAGTAGQFVLTGLPLAARSANSSMVMWGFIYDASANTVYNVSGFLASTTTVYFLYQTGNAWGSSPNIALASGDQLNLAFSYEVA